MTGRPRKMPTKTELLTFDVLLGVSVVLFSFVFLSGVFFWGRVLVRAIF